MNIHIAKIHNHIKIHHKKYLLAGFLGGLGFFALKASVLLFGIAGIFQENNSTYADLSPTLCDEVTDISTGECQALIDIYNSTKGTFWLNGNIGRGSTGSAGSRQGVTVNGGRVTQLDLSTNGLDGAIPSSISNLTGLTYLNLSENDKITTIPNLSALTNLQELNLYEACKRGGVPAGISSLSNLLKLSLGNNNLSTFPSIGTLTSLQELKLDLNNLTTLPSLAGFTSLSSLDVSDNNFSTFPNIGTPPALTVLKVYGNSSLYSISNIANLTTLVSLDASDCIISSLPSNIDDLTSLTYLDLSYNSLYEYTLGTFTGLNLSAGDVTQNCISLYQTGGDALYNYFTSNPSVSYIAQKSYCGHIYDTTPTCSVDYDHSVGVRTNSTVRATVSCNEGYNIRPIDYQDPSYYDFNDNAEGPYSFSIANSVRGWTDTINNVDFDRIDKEYPVCGSVTYTPGATAADPVTASVSCSDDPSGVNNATSVLSKQFSTNGVYTSTNGLYATDYAGNRTYVTVTINTIIGRYPSCTALLTPSSWTSGDVVVSLINCSGQPVLVGTDWTQTFTDNGSYSTMIEDGDGDQTTITGSVTNIDKTAPNCGPISYSPSGPTITSGNVVASMTCRDIQSGIGGSTASGVINKTITSSGSSSRSISDDLGNQYTTATTVTWIDKGNPTCDVIYSPGSGTKTSGDVMAILTGCSADIANYTSLGGSGHLFTGNGEFLFEFEDGAGNTGSLLTSVNRIDKTKPVCGITHSITGSFTNQTNQNVLSSLTGCSEEIIVTNPSDGTGEYLFTGNGEFIFEFRDEAGNTGSYSDLVYWIDNDAPRCVVSYTPSSGTNGNVVATLSQCSKTPIIVNNNDFSENRLFTGNGNFTFEYRDNLGNTGFTVATVTRIDKEKPVCSVSYSPSSTTSSSVIATLTSCSKVPTTVTNNNSSTNYTFTNNGNFVFEYIDALGNTGSTTAAVTWIYRSSGGGGGGRINKDICLDGDFSPSFYDGTCKSEEIHGSAPMCEVEKPYKFSTEQVTAFQRAYSLGITTMCPIEKAGLNSNLIRKHMAKMISEFAMDIIGMEPDTSKKCNFSDISKETNELQDYIKLSCQLGLMGYQTDGVTKKTAFEPNKVVTRAQFSAILSRLIRGTKYAGGEPYYTKHAKALKDSQIMDKSINVFMTPQIRGPMLIMLMRAKVYLDK